MEQVQAATSRQGFFRYGALIGGGLGPNVWDREVHDIYAVDLKDAANQAMAIAEEMRGWAMSVYQED